VGNEIRMMAVCRTLTESPVTTFVDPFTGSALTADWNPDVATWTIDGVARTGQPTVGEGFAHSSTVSQLRTAALDDKSVSTTAYREISVRPSGMDVDTKVHLLMDMNVTTPVPAASIRLEATFTSAYKWRLRLYVNETLVKTYQRSTSEPAVRNYTIRLSIDASNTIRAYWDQATVARITYQSSGYVPAGGRVGFGLLSSSVYGIVIDDFNYSYSPSTGVNPARMLMASANGKLYKETTAGGMALVSSSLTLRNDRLLSAANRLEKLFIADYDLRVEGTAATSSTTTLTHASITTSLGIDTDDDRVELISGTGITIGVYGISSVGSGSLVMTSSAGASGSAIAFRVIRGPKVYDAATNALTMLGLGTIGVSQFPVGFRHFSLWADKIVATNDPTKMQQWQMSAQGYPLLWNHGDNETVGENGLTTDTIKLTLGVGAACSSAVAVNSAQLGEPIVCTIPINDTYLIFACRFSFHVLRGNPKIDGEMITLSRDVGILDIGAHVRTPDGRIIVMTLDGLYEATSQGVTIMSRDVLPLELVGINAERYEVTLGYDFQRRGICIACVARDAVIDPTLPAIHYFYDLRTEGYFPDTYDADHDPTAMAAHQVGGLGEQVLLRGCRDGYIRQFNDQTGTDDSVPFTSYVYYGPLRLGAGEYGDGILHEVVDVLDDDSGSIILAAYVGHSAEAALAAIPRWETTMAAGRNRNRWPRLRGGALYLLTTGTPGFAWARESLTITREQLDKLRKTSEV
jgi:hypothetical protein